MVKRSRSFDVPPWRPGHFVGGHPALDLVNTVSHRLDPALAIDRMNAPSKIAAWAVEVDLLTAAEAARLEPEGLVDGVARLRAAAAEVFDAAAADRSPPPAALARILSLAGARAVELAGVPDDAKVAARVRPTRLDAPGLIAALALLVLDGVFRLPRGRVRACPRCGWLFRDDSKGGRRRWCSMKVCGNRDKVGRHYHAQRGVRGAQREGDST